MRDALQNRSFLLMLAVVTLLFLYLLKPFFGAVLWACIIAVLFHPLQRRLLARWGRWPNLVALMTLFACIVVVIIPVLFVLGAFFQQGASLYQRLESGEIDPRALLRTVQDAFPFAQSILERLGVEFEDLGARISSAAVAVSGFVAQHAVQLGQGTMQFFVNLGVMLYLAFFLLRDGRKLIDLMIRALPLGDERENLLLAKFSEVARATVKGNLVIAIIQGTLGGLIFWVLGISAALLWGVVMVLMSLIPAVGAGLIWGPVAIYLFATGDWIQGLVLTLFGILVIGLVDNLLRPILVGRDTRLPDYVVLLSTLSGLMLFGLNGFVIGPLIAVLFTAFWGIFMRDFNPSPAADRKNDFEQ